MIALTGILILCVLPATMSRSAWIAAAVGCGWVAYMHRDKRRWYVLWERYKRRYVLWGTGIFFLLILGGVGAFVLKPDSALGRLFMWKVTCKAIANHPWGGVKKVLPLLMVRRRNLILSKGIMLYGKSV